jgi:N-acetylglucosaminyl-diphospho-decaprenol L-rhamnosyltransferase
MMRTESETAVGKSSQRRSDSLPTVDVVIVNWNTGPYLHECLCSLAAAERNTFRLGKVVVVDNASSDDSLKGIDSVPLPVNVLRNRDNRGFGAASNQGARKCTSDYLLLLNPDTRVFADTLDLSVSFMNDPANAAVGICGGRMIGDDDAHEFSCWRFPTFWMWAAKITGLAYVFPRWIPLQRMTNEEVGGSGVVDQVIGAYNLIRRPLFEALNGFDERFFMYLEDVDLAFRARRLGYSSYFLGDVPIYHVGRASSEQVRGKRLFYLLRSRTEYARKHWPRWQAALLALLILAVEFPARCVLGAAGGRGAAVTEVGEAASRYARYLVLGR